MKTYIFALVFCTHFFTSHLIAQSYSASNYANVGDTIYLTQSGLANFNFDTTGVGITWDYSSLEGNSQRVITFRSPNQTGYTALQFPFIYNSNNTNIAQTDGQSINLGNSLQASNFNAYYKKTNSFLQQSASAYNIVLGDTEFSIKNTFSSPDVVYKFPLAYNNVDSSTSGYTTNIPGVYYRNTELKRVNRVVGSGTVITPYGTFANALKIVSDIVQVDSLSIDTLAFPSTTVKYREIKFLDNTKKYPVVIVNQILTGNTYVTTSIEYMDDKQYFPPLALFVYYPVCAAAGDTVIFQNLSQNVSSLLWNFDDPDSGSADTSTTNNPTHIFSQGGTYQVSLVVFNGPLSDTLVVPVVVYNDLNNPTISITMDSSKSCVGEPVTFTASITNGGETPVFNWYRNGSLILGEDLNVFSTTSLANGDSIYCRLISSSFCIDSLSAISNTLIFSLTEIASPTLSIEASATNICAGTLVIFTAMAEDGGANPIYQWNKNGINVGSNSNVYNANDLVNNDVIGCLVITNGLCQENVSAASNYISISVVDYLTPSITISASDEVICQNEPVTFQADAVNGGNSPVYQWKKNGIDVGSNSAFFTTNDISNDDVIVVVLTANNSCQPFDTALSNELTIVVSQLYTPSVVITSSANDVCAGSEITFDALISDEAINPVYHWMKNELEVWGNTSSYTGDDCSDGDVLTCEISTSNLCQTSASATSNVIVLNILPLPEPLVNQNGDSLMTGTFSFYQWIMNGNLIDSETDQIYLPTASGSYTVTVTDENGCANTSQPLDYIVSAHEEIILKDEVLIFPNPTNGSGVSIYSAELILSVTIYDSMGKSVASIQGNFLNTHHIMTDRWSNGVYLLNIKTETNNYCRSLIVSNE